MCVECEQESECERVEDVWEERRRQKERRRVRIGGDGTFASLIHPRPDGRERIHAGQSNEIKRAKRIDVHQCWQREKEIGHVGRRPVPHEPDVPILALDVRVDRGERAPVAPLRTHHGVWQRGRTEADVACVVVVHEWDKGDRDEDGAVQYPSWREL